MKACKDLTGQRFGNWVVVGFFGKRTKQSARYWKCKCDCGNVSDVFYSSLVRGQSKSCGCVNRVKKDRSHKVCPRCEVDLSINDFHKCSAYPDGHKAICKLCMSKENKKNRKTSSKKEMERYHNNTNFRIAKLMRCRINNVLRGNIKSSTTFDLLGCGTNVLKMHLESMFSEEMSWNNHGQYWEIDHIRPCASFELSSPEQQRICFNYKNLRPMVKHENTSKGSLYNGVRYYYGQS